MFKQVLIITATLAAAAFAHHLKGAPHVASARLRSDNVDGNITFTQLEDNKVRVQGTIIGLAPGQYGFHVHEKGDLSNGCASTGSHYNPENQPHGHPEDKARHVGDLGNVEFDANNIATIDFVDSLLSLEGEHNIIGRAVVLHERADDYGRSDHPDSRKTGNAGGRVACGVIGILDPVYYTYTWNAAPKTSVTSTITLLFILALFVH
ncbi:superoxide dismutase [Cu-Zn]-like [Achroia grisella]|uniref:superoxide dismutase [Cu-Zn]-like n=1 Tax=Achroia grisella TaxID=688607 RepID=UPI0027D2E824|nr:superoxide dismutase [Cu-Zn]-like [Achroia grisella]XP_059061724.1 superoxide dismutase [Cu-Zn]-like [Achroia grisella]